MGAHCLSWTPRPCSSSSAGSPGTGKTTLARRPGPRPRRRAPADRHDRAGRGPVAARRAAAAEVGHTAAAGIAARRPCARGGLPVVADCVNPVAERRWSGWLRRRRTRRACPAEIRLRLLGDPAGAPVAEGPTGHLVVATTDASVHALAQRRRGRTASPSRGRTPRSSRARRSEHSPAKLHEPPLARERGRRWITRLGSDQRASSAAEAAMSLRWCEYGRSICSTPA